jgi:hypothetical protein
MFCNATLLAVFSTMTLNTGFAQEADNANATTIATVTNATGTITQVNYDQTGAIDGFLVGTNIFLSFPTNVCGGIGTLGVAGNSVTYSGASRTNSTTSFQSVIVTSFTNNVTHVTYTKTTSVPTVTAYGPTSGTIKALNYDPSGAVDGFLFTPAGGTASVLIATGEGASSTLKPLLTVGGTVSVTGRTITEPPTCITGVLTVVTASSLVINGQTIVISGHRIH